MAHTAVAMQSVGFYTAARAVHPSIIQSLLFIISSVNLVLLLKQIYIDCTFTKECGLGRISISTYTYVLSR